MTVASNLCHLCTHGAFCLFVFISPPPTSLKESKYFVLIEKRGAWLHQNRKYLLTWGKAQLNRSNMNFPLSLVPNVSSDKPSGAIKWKRCPFKVSCFIKTSKYSWTSDSKWFPPTPLQIEEDFEGQQVFAVRRKFQDGLRQQLHLWSDRSVTLILFQCIFKDSLTYIQIFSEHEHSYSSWHLLYGWSCAHLSPQRCYLLFLSMERIWKKLRWFTVGWILPWKKHFRCLEARQKFELHSPKMWICMKQREYLKRQLLFREGQ